MTDLNFIATAQHNVIKIKKDTRVFLYLMTASVVIMGIARLFYPRYTAVYMYVKSREEVTLGWPASLFGIATFMLIAFGLFLMYHLLRQDLKKPALGVTNQVLFLNQQILKNALIPWDNIEKAELRGHISDPVLRIFFKDIDAVLKSQFFILKSIAKSSLKTNQSIGITKKEANGDLINIFKLIGEKGVPALNLMAGGKTE